MKERSTTTEDVLAVLAVGERISWTTLIARLHDAELPVSGLTLACEDPRLVEPWRTGEVYSPLHVYDDKARGPLFVERAA